MCYVKKAILTDGLLHQTVYAYKTQPIEELNANTCAEIDAITLEVLAYVMKNVTKNPHFTVTNKCSHLIDLVFKGKGLN